MSDTISNKTKWNNVILLSSSQVLFQTPSILVMTLSGMVGFELVNDKSLATLPIAMISVGTAMMMIPASFVIRKLGQKKAFMMGTLVGVLAGILAFNGVLHCSFPMFVIGNMLIGCYHGFAQYYRFAAADTVPKASKGKADGVVAAIVGPNLAKYTRHIGNIGLLIHI